MRSRNRDGFALVTVLWALVVIGILAVEFHTLGRADRRVAMNARSAVRARWAARGELARTLDALDRALAAAQLAPAGETVLGPFEAESNGVVSRSTVLDASGRLNLSRAGRRELVHLLEALAIPPAESQAIIEAVRRSPLDAVEELRSLAQVTAGTYERIAPHVTVYGDGRVNVNSASVPVLMTLPEMTQDGARAIVARRRVAAYRNVFEILAMLPGPVQARMQSRLGELVDRIAFTPRVVDITVGAGARDEALRVRLVSTVLLSGGAKWGAVRTVEDIGAAEMGSSSGRQGEQTP
jgi:type II secretory pathway component PulK